MTVSSVNNASGNNQGGNGNSAADLSESFMKLLVAQMQNQDPTNPMDNNQLTSQLAQFNTAAGIETLNKSVYAVGMMLQNMNEMSATSWVGRNVYTEGDAKVTWGSQNTIQADDELSFNLKGEADKVTVTFTDEIGKAYTAELKGAKAGVNTFSLDDLENFQPSEPDADVEYKVTYSASRASGDAPTITGLISNRVEGVSFNEEGAVMHLVGGKTVTLRDLYLIQ
ncbi:flagellar hook assembly protein FlgD [Cedecea sp.]|jgi:flagellar basal-body rod modification protein FlgD|uniref:flagellar hook assembly protein FlgD n=1 Tax=Cedecea sp. TaxID=1970739 RepID=UPI002F42A4C6